jgi:hypothetical protein
VAIGPLSIDCATRRVSFAERMREPAGTTLATSKCSSVRRASPVPVMPQKTLGPLPLLVTPITSS